MSRFFVAGYNSESSSEEEDLLSSSEEELISSEEESTDSEFGSNDSDSDSDSDDQPTGPAYFLKKSFIKGGDSDSDSEDEGRKVVKSAKDKLLDDMRESIESINVAKRINNWQVVLSEFDKLGRYLIKTHQQNIGIPNFYIKLLGGLEDFINETAENEKLNKSLNAGEARAFNTVRQRVKKQAKEFQAHYNLFREQPELFDSETPVEITLTKEEQQDEDAFISSNNRILSPIFTTLKVISESRGKKNIDKFEQIETLEKLLKENAKGSEFELICIYQMLLSIRFDSSTNQTYMSLDQWKECQKDLNSLLEVLEGSKVYQVSELGTLTDEIDIEPEVSENGFKVISGSITSLIDRLDDEFIRSLQNIDPHSLEYVSRLKDEGLMYKLIVRGQVYIERITPAESKLTTEQLARVVLRRLEHVYYKPDQLISVMETAVGESSTPKTLVNSLSSLLTSHSNKIYGKTGLLLKIYYYAINNNYLEAREIFLNSKISTSIHSADSSLQVQYNRAIVQLGLSAFRSGFIEESNKILNEIINSQRLKELLGQGFNSKYPNQATIIEKQKLLPFYQHINLELLECVFMTCSLLIEIPNLALISNSNSKRKSSIKSFKSKLEFHERQFFTGPPESIKDHIIHASIALQKGDWLKSYNLLSSIKIWKLFPDNEELLVMLKNQLQVEGLRTYIFTYKSIFSKLSIEKLASIFQLEEAKVVEILQKLIENDVVGTFDDDFKYINFISNDVQRSRLQELAIIMNEKVGLLTEKNEKTSSNGYGKKQPAKEQKEMKEQKEQQREQKDAQLEESNRFRYANVVSGGDEFLT